MKTKDFEMAIEALGCRIEIDEIKLHQRQVAQVLGHNEHNLLLWDERGRGFSISYDAPYFCTADNHDYHLADDYERDEMFDLKFE